MYFLKRSDMATQFYRQTRRICLIIIISISIIIIIIKGIYRAQDRPGATNAFTPQPKSITALWLVLILPSRGG